MGNLATTPAQVEEAEGGFEMIPEGGLQSSHEDGAPGESSEKSTSQDVTMLARRTSIPQSHHEEDKVDADDQMDDQAVDEVSLGDYVLFKRPASRANASAPHLGKGSFATVYLGEHAPTGQQVAIKVIGIGKWYEKNKIVAGIKALPPKQMGYIESEIQMQSESSGHPNVVTLHSVVRSTEGRYMYLVMELCEGGTLKDFLQHSGGSFDEMTARTFLRQLAGGLYWIKTRPGNSAFVHRDLKPENFMLSEISTSATLKIADFGFARIPEPGEDMLQSMVGTPYFMAPEIHNRQGYDDTADLWAIGVVLFQSIFGHVMVEVTQASPLEVMKRKIRDAECYRDHLKGDDLEIDRRLSPHCRDLLQRLLHPDPTKRISFTQFMSHPFVDLATAFVEQGQELLKAVHEGQFHQRAFELLKGRLTEIQENSQIRQHENETERAAMFEQATQSNAEIARLKDQVAQLQAEVEERQQAEQQAVQVSITDSQAKDEAERKFLQLQEQNAMVEPESSGVSESIGLDVDRTALNPGDRVLFLKKSGEPGQVAFSAVCAGSQAYFLHAECLPEGLESRDYLVGTILALDETQDGNTMVFSDIERPQP